MIHHKNHYLHHDDILSVEVISNVIVECLIVVCKYALVSENYLFDNILRFADSICVHKLYDGTDEYNDNKYEKRGFIYSYVFFKIAPKHRLASFWRQTLSRRRRNICVFFSVTH